MKKWLLCLCVLLALTSCKEEKKTNYVEAKPVVKIGVIYPMSGEYAHFGNAMKDAIKLFENENKTKSSPFKYSFFLEDGAFNLSRSATVAKKLIDIDNVDFIITLSSDIGTVVSPITQMHKVIHLSLATEPNVATGEYNFTISTPPNKNTYKMIEELLRLNLKDVAFVVQNTSMMQSVAGYIRQMNKEHKINILSDNSINSGERDFRLLIRKILKNAPKAIITQLQPPELQIFVKQLREINKDIVITAVESFSYPEDKTLFEGQWFSGAVVPSHEYVNEFKKISNQDTTYISELFYAALEVIRASYDPKNKSKTIENIKNLKMKSFAIGDFSFNEQGIMQTDGALYMIKNGQIEAIY